MAQRAKVVNLYKTVIAIINPQIVITIKDKWLVKIKYFL